MTSCASATFFLFANSLSIVPGKRSHTIIAVTNPGLAGNRDTNTCSKCSVLFVVCSVRCAVCSVQWTLCSEQCAVFSTEGGF